MTVCFDLRFPRRDAEGGGSNPVMIHRPLLFERAYCQCAVDLLAVCEHHRSRVTILRQGFFVTTPHGVVL